MKLVAEGAKMMAGNSKMGCDETAPVPRLKAKLATC
jgi:hypothetical protein